MINISMNTIPFQQNEGKYIMCMKYIDLLMEQQYSFNSYSLTLRAIHFSQKLGKLILQEGSPFIFFLTQLLASLKNMNRLWSTTVVQHEFMTSFSQQSCLLITCNPMFQQEQRLLLKNSPSCLASPALHYPKNRCCFN